MSYKIAQDFKYVGNDYWRWRAWIEAEEAELREVEEVTWILHPSFKRSRVIRKDRATRFRLETAGWGTFLLRAEVRFESGETRLLQHRLRLEYSDDKEETSQRGDAEPTSRARLPLTVFLSYGGGEARLASKLREGLSQAGVAVLDQTMISEGEPWAETVRRMISKADAVVGVIGEDEVSPFVIEELRTAEASAKPMIALLSPDRGGVELPDSVKRVTFDPSAPEVFRKFDQRNIGLTNTRDLPARRHFQCLTTLGAANGR
jgi:hypothetical protein